MTTTKLSATAIKAGKSLPPRLLAIGREIEVRVARTDTYHTKAADMVDSITQLLVEAENYCDKGGFAAFRKRYLPSLERSRAYKLLSIASGRKSAHQLRAEGAARQARHIAKLKAAAAAMKRLSVTDNTKLPAPHSAHGARDGHDTLRRFTARVLELVLMTATAEPKTFNGAAIEADDLRKLADFLIAVADLHRPKLRVVR
jgi:hypothetical protein